MIYKCTVSVTMANKNYVYNLYYDILVEADGIPNDRKILGKFIAANTEVLQKPIFKEYSVISKQIYIDANDLFFGFAEFNKTSYN